MRRASLVLALVLIVAVPAAAQTAPKLITFKSTGRIASGKVARYDLKEESTDFTYRIQAEYIQAKVQKLREGRWVTIGKAKAKPPRPLDFWPVFKKMGTGKYRIVARAYSGEGDELQASGSKSVRFTVVSHIPHSD